MCGLVCACTSTLGVRRQGRRWAGASCHHHVLVTRCSTTANVIAAEALTPPGLTKQSSQARCTRPSHRCHPRFQPVNGRPQPIPVDALAPAADSPRFSPGLPSFIYLAFPSSARPLFRLSSPLCPTTPSLLLLLIHHHPPRSPATSSRLAQARANNNHTTIATTATAQQSSTPCKLSRQASQQAGNKPFPHPCPIPARSTLLTPSLVSAAVESKLVSVIRTNSSLAKTSRHQQQHVGTTHQGRLRRPGPLVVTTQGDGDQAPTSELECQWSHERQRPG